MFYDCYCYHSVAIRILPGWDHWLWATVEREAIFVAQRFVDFSHGNGSLSPLCIVACSVEYSDHKTASETKTGDYETKATDGCDPEHSELLRCIRYGR